MSKVVPFQKKQPDRRYLSGHAKCAGCGHKWAAVAPVGEPSGLECPECQRFTGVMLYECRPNGEIFVCNCGCDVYRLSRTEVMCISCGSIVDPW